MLSCAQNVHVHTVPSRVVVALSNGHFDLDEQLLLCVDAIEILSFEYVQRKESPTLLSVGHVWLQCLWFVYFMSIFCFSWALKLDDIQRWRADPRDLGRRVFGSVPLSSARFKWIQFVQLRYATLRYAKGRRVQFRYVALLYGASRHVTSSCVRLLEVRLGWIKSCSVMTSQVTLRNATHRYIESGSVQFGQVKSEVKWSEVQWSGTRFRCVTCHFKNST